MAANVGYSRGAPRFNQASMPARIQCSVGLEWCLAEKFSKNQLTQFHRRVRDGLATAADSGISCREHSGEPAKELQCEGPCSKMRPLKDFSRNTRTNGRNWCKDCVAWQLSLESGETTFAAPVASQMAQDRHLLRDYLAPSRNPMEDGLFDYETDAASSFGSVSDSMSLLDLDSESDDVGPVDAQGFPVNPRPPTSVATAMSQQTESQPAPLYLNRTNLPSREELEELQRAADQQKSRGTGNSRQRRPSFNAFGPNGERLRVQNVLTETSDGSDDTTTATATATAKTPGSTTGRGIGSRNLAAGQGSDKGWTRVPKRKTKPDIPAYLERYATQEEHFEEPASERKIWSDGESDDTM